MWMKGLEPPTSGPKSGALTSELHPQSLSPKRRRTQRGKAACAGGGESSNRCARFGFRDRERAYRPCDGLSQAALSRQICGFFRELYFSNTGRRDGSESDAAQHLEAVTLRRHDHGLALARRHAGERLDVFEMRDQHQIVGA